jgi:hypothetical protein
MLLELYRTFADFFPIWDFSRAFLNISSISLKGSAMLQWAFCMLMSLESNSLLYEHIFPSVGVQESLRGLCCQK